MDARKVLQFTNQSTDCLFYCDSSSPGCNPKADLDYFPPPSPPSPPPPPPPQLSSKHHQNISPYIIISVAVFASLFLLVSYYLIIVKNCLNWNRRRTPPPQSSDEDFFDENRAPVFDHPIWYINTVGLQPSVIDKITIFKFKTGNGMIEGTNCSVCLNEFQDDESLRLLPNCKHAFHIHCIDTWLRSHTNCPLCRSGIVNSLNAPAVDSIEPNLGTILSTNEGSLLENDEQREVSSNNEVTNREFHGNQEEFLQIESMGTSRDGEVQPMRRSVSVDSSISSSIGLGHMSMLSRMSEGENSSSRITSTTGSASTLHKEEPVLMKRSFSYGGRSFFSRHHRSRSSVLPL